MNKVMHKIIIDCERMKYHHTGLYHYCLQLVRSLQQSINPQNEELSLYIRPAEYNIFANNAKYIRQHSLQKFLLPLLGGYEIWHATYQATNYYPFQRKIKIVLTIHDLNFMHDESKAFFKQRRELKKLQRKINRADHIVAVSNFTLQDIKKYLNLYDTPATVIYNGCNFSTITKTIRPQNIPRHFFLYTIGTITDKKNFHVLPALLVNNNLDLIISGITQSDSYKDKILAEAEKHGVKDRIIFTGSISENDKQWYMKNCEAFVFPSFAEGFGLPVIEAMHFGKAVILSSLTALPEIGGDTAYYFQNFEPSHMQDVLQKSLRHYHSSDGIKEKIKQRAAFFTWEQTASQYIAVYRSLY
jgi:glycosyltransferase involved in cell wall biosynthesis